MTKKKTKKKKKGFTLIELLIVIAIIGILASIVLVSLNGARNRATVAAYKSTVASIQPGVVLCCDLTTNTLNTVAGGDICTPNTGALLPLPADMKATTAPYAVLRDCATSDPAITVTPTGLPTAGCNGAAATVSTSKVTFPANCS